MKLNNGKGDGAPSDTALSVKKGQKMFEPNCALLRVTNWDTLSDELRPQNPVSTRAPRFTISSAQTSTLDPSSKSPRAPRFQSAKEG